MRDDLNLDHFKRQLEKRLEAIDHGQAMAQATVRDIELELQRIKDALDNLQSGSYGQCVKCGNPIPRGQLQSDPAASICYGCSQAMKNP